MGTGTIAPPTKTKAKRASRGTTGSRTSTTLSRQPTYTVAGNIYSRLMFSDAGVRAIPGKPMGTIPMSYENVFERGAPFQIGVDDYPMVSTEITLHQGNENKVMEKVSCESDGTFAFTKELKTKKEYRLVAHLDTGDYDPDQGMIPRVFPERVTCTFKVNKIPMGLKTAKIKTTTRHDIKVDHKSWTKVDSETLEPVIEGSVLHFAGPDGALVFDTFGLDVEYMSQHLSPNLKRDLSNLRFHNFTYDRKTYKVALHHLCLSTCTTIMLRYYEVKFKGAAPRIEDIAEAAARFVLDFHTGKTKRPEWSKEQIDTEALEKEGIVQFKDKSYPHNSMDYILRGAENLLKTHAPKETFTWGGGQDNLVKTEFPSLTCFLGLGWPVVLADDLAGNWEHARVCIGGVITSKGKISRLYGLDPSYEERLEIKTDGTGTDLGWCLLCRPLKQSEVSPSRLWDGGTPPAPRRPLSF